MSKTRRESAEKIVRQKGRCNGIHCYADKCIFLQKMGQRSYCIQSAYLVRLRIAQAYLEGGEDD
jgi:hypothetical protein